MFYPAKQWPTKTDVLNCPIHDPRDIANYYDGLYNTFAINARRLGINLFFAKNDTLSVQLLNIDQQTYEYLKGLQSILDQRILSDSTPANPTNNISNNGLGYFSARSITEKTIFHP